MQSVGFITGEHPLVVHSKEQKIELDSYSGNCAISDSCPIWLIKVVSITCESTRVKSRDLAGSAVYHAHLGHLLFACNSTSGTRERLFLVHRLMDAKCGPSKFARKP